MNLSKREYAKRRIQVLETYAPFIIDCKKCGSPCADGYCCLFCGDSNPTESLEEKLKSDRFHSLENTGGQCAHCGRRSKANREHPNIRIRSVCFKCFESLVCNIAKIISGGQTGADMGGLLAATEVGIPTGGVAPKGWRTEKGPNPGLSQYGLIQSMSSNYSVRTRDNIRISDGTVIFGVISGGSKRTASICDKLGKPYIVISRAGVKDIQTCSSLRTWIINNNIKILNVAGNRESKSPGMEQAVKNYLLSTFKLKTLL